LVFLKRSVVVLLVVGLAVGWISGFLGAIYFPSEQLGVFQSKDYLELKSAYESLAEEHGQLQSHYNILQAQYSSLKNEYDTLRKEHNELVKKYSIISSLLSPPKKLNVNVIYVGTLSFTWSEKAEIMARTYQITFQIVNPTSNGVCLTKIEYSVKHKDTGVLLGSGTITKRTIIPENTYHNWVSTYFTVEKGCYQELASLRDSSLEVHGKAYFETPLGRTSIPF